MRTLLAWPEDAPKDALFVKASMAYSPLFGDRRLFAAKIAYSVGVTRLVEESLGYLPPGLDYLRETIAFAPRDMPGGGVIFRTIPSAVIENRIVCVPVFALMGESDGHEPLLLALARSGLDPFDFVESRLCAEIARIWIATALGIGMLPEIHGQNLLLTLSPDLRCIGGFMYRDMDGLLIDWQLRNIRGLPKLENLPHSFSWFETYGALFAKDPYCGLIWWKMQVSLHAYLHHVLNEMNNCLILWQRNGYLGGRRVEPDELTMSFSRHVMATIKEMCGTSDGLEYNIYRNMNRFLLFLHKIRRNCVCNTTVPLTEVSHKPAQTGKSTHRISTP